MELGTFVVVEHRGHPLNRLVGKIVGKRVEIVGGLILIGIGVKIVIDHMA